MGVDLSSVGRIMEKLCEAEYDGEEEEKEAAQPYASEEMDAVEDGRARKEEIPNLERLKALLMVSADEEVAQWMAEQYGDLCLLILLNEDRSARYKELALLVLGNISLRCLVSEEALPDIMHVVLAQTHASDCCVVVAACAVVQNACACPAGSSSWTSYLTAHPPHLYHLFFTLLPHPLTRLSLLHLFYTFLYTTPDALATLLSIAPAATWSGYLHGVFTTAHQEGSLAEMRGVAAAVDLLKQFGVKEVQALAAECFEATAGMEEQD